MDDTRIKDILETTQSIALVGASPKPERDSNQVLRFLLTRGYNVTPINPKPGLKMIAGQHVTPRLKDLTTPPDMIDIFRRSDALMGMLDEILAIRPKTVWTQLGVESAEFKDHLENAGIDVVMNRCPKIEIPRLL